MISIPIWVFVLMCIACFIIALEIVIFIIASVDVSKEEIAEIKKNESDEKLKESIKIAKIMDPDNNPEYIPKEYRNPGNEEYPKEG